MPRFCSLRMIVGEGGAPAVVILMPRSSPWAREESAMMEQTVGAPHRCVTPRSSMASHTGSSRTPRRHRWVPPAAVTAQGVHQPLQWNIGRVQR